MTAARRRAGFTLIELGIVLAVIAVLATVVLVGRGYLESSRQRAAIDQIQTLRGAARQWSTRMKGGLSYTDVALAQLPGIPANLRTPWGSGNITVAATSTPGGDCRGDSCVRVCLEMPSAQGCDQLRPQVPGAVSANCTTCGGAPCLCVVAR